MSFYRLHRPPLILGMMLLGGMCYTALDPL